jgi:uncharacterized protein (TIGR02391 family)
MPRKSAAPKKPPPPIKLQEVLAQTPRRSYEQLRLSRVQYKDNPNTYIDLRVFHRAYDDDGNEIYHPTKQGVHVDEEQMQRLIGKWTLVPSVVLHPVIKKQSLPALQREEFDTAVFRALKAVEVRVRQLSKLPAELVGTGLMRRAFDVDSGPLSDMTVPKAEREARAHLFSGAVGCYKNPHSHREVSLSFQEAFEVLLLASHLMRTLDRLPPDAL